MVAGAKAAAAGFWLSGAGRLRYGRGMAKATRGWTVLPHRPIEKVTENLWRVEGDLPGMPLKRVMTVARRSDGSLLVHNGIALGDEEMRQIEEFGRIAFVVVPNGYHRLDAGAYKERYPQAKVLCPKGVREKVAEVVTVDGTYEDLLPDEAMSLTKLDGMGMREGVLLVWSQDGVTAVFNDVLFNMPHVGGMQGLVLKHLTQSTGGLRVTRVAKLFFIKDQAALRAHLERIADTPHLRRIIVSHHEMFVGDARTALRQVAATIG